MKRLLLFVFSLFYCCRLSAQPGPEQLQERLARSRADTGRVSLLLQLANHYLVKPGESPTDLNRTLDYSQQALDLSRQLKQTRWEGKSWIMLADGHRESEHEALAIQCVRNAIATLRACDCADELGDAYATLADATTAHAETGLMDLLGYYRQAIGYYQRAGNKLKEAHTRKSAGDLLQVANEMEPALAELQHALALYQSIGYEKLQSIHDLIGYVYTEMSDYDNAFRYSLAALRTGEAQRDSSGQMSTIYNRHGIVLCRLMQYDSALAYMKKGTELALRNHDSISFITIGLNIINVYTRMNRNAEALELLDDINRWAPGNFRTISMQVSYLLVFLNMKAFERSAPYVEWLVEKGRQVDDTQYERFSLIAALIRYYLAVGNFEQARRYSADYLSMGKRIGSPSLRSEGYLWMYKTDSAIGNYHAAISDYQSYIAVRDSIFTGNKSRQIAELQIQYEADRKSQQINLLNERELRNQGQLEQVRTARNVIIAGSGMLLLILGLGYNRYRLKQRTNRELELKQLEIYHKNESLRKLLDEKEWLIKEVHHRVKNNMQIVMSLLHSQTMYLGNDAAVNAIKDSRTRMHAMSLIHQQLYQSELASSLQMPGYVRELAQYLQDSLDPDLCIRIDCAVEPLELDVVQAVPVGLILNEAITNAMKYAFPEGRRGMISISIALASQRVLMSVSDDGVGLAELRDLKRNSSLGMSLLEGLTRQLDGNIAFVNHNGLRIEIDFPLLDIRNFSRPS